MEIRKELHDMIMETKSSDDMDRILDIFLKMEERINEVESICLGMKSAVDKTAQEASMRANGIIPD